MSGTADVAGSRTKPGARRTGGVVSLQLCRAHGRPPARADAAVALPDRGLEGDLHARREGGRRQVLLVDLSALRALGLAPGDLREQVTVDLPGLMELSPGGRLRVGEALLAATGPCEPCRHIGELLGKDDTDVFRLSLEGRRGILTRVVSVVGGGRIRVGDPVEIV